VIIASDTLSLSKNIEETSEEATMRIVTYIEEVDDAPGCVAD
jgi:hypothetical protein